MQVVTGPAGAGTQAADRRARVWVVLDCLSFAAGLLLAGPLTISRAGGWYDDFLFVRLSHFILQGQWLGPFDSLTLIKGPFYPLFLAACAAGGVPVQVATQCVTLCGCLLLARMAGLLAGKRWIGSLCFALLALNPACFDWSTTMLMREPLYGGLTTLVLALGARTFLGPGGTLGWSAMLGVAGAAFWLTREEGILMVPPMLLMAAWHVHARRRTLLRALGEPALSGLTCLALVLAVCAANQHAYGVFRTNDVKGGPFARAYGAMVRVDPQRWRQLVPVARETRLRIYAASPAAAELKPFIEGNAAHLDTDVDCGTVPRPECHDIDSAHFLFALRDAASRAGHYRTADEADRFYRRLAGEIGSACSSRVLQCSGKRQSLWPQFSVRYARPLAYSLYRIITDTTRLGDPHSGSVPSLVHGDDAAAYDDLAFATPIAPPRELMTAPGWQVSGAFSTEEPGARMVVAGPPGTAIQSDLRQTINDAISDALHHPPGQGQGFDDAVRCQPGDCRLELLGAHATLGRWALASLAPGVVLNTPAATVFINTVTPLQTYASRLYRPTLRTRLMRACDRLLPGLTALMSLPALAWVVVRCVGDVRRRSFQPLTVLALALTVTIAGRVALLSLLDATTVAVQFRYEAPATGALLCLVGLTIGRAIDAAALWYAVRPKGAANRPC